MLELMIGHFEYHNTFSRLSFCLVQLHRWHFRLINWLVYRSAAIMASCDKIELFKFVRKTYQDIGIFPPESNPNFNSINLKNGLFSFCLIQFLISTAAYLWFEAKSMIEYGIICYTCTTIIFSLAVYLIFLWQSRNILIYIENFEWFIEKSEYFPISHPFGTFNFLLAYNCVCTGIHSMIIYKNGNEQIERIMEFLVYACSAISLLLPFLFYSLHPYQILHFGFGKRVILLIFSDLVCICVEIRTKLFANCFLLVSMGKGAIWLGDTIRVFGGMGCPKCRPCWPHNHCTNKLQYCIWIELAIHCDCTRHHKRFGHFQQHGENHKKS